MLSCALSRLRETTTMKLRQIALLLASPLIIQFQTVTADPQPNDIDVLDTAPKPAAPMEEYVSLRMSGEFSDGSCCLVDPSTGFIPQLDMGQFGGRNLLVEYVSCQALIPQTQPVNLYIGENGQNAPVDALIAIELSEQFSALASDSLSGTAFHAVHAVKVIVDSDDDLLLNGRRPVASSGVGRASCVVAGRLVSRTKHTRRLKP